MIGRVSMFSYISELWESIIYENNFPQLLIIKDSFMCMLEFIGFSDNYLQTPIPQHLTPPNATVSGVLMNTPILPAVCHC